MTTSVLDRVVRWNLDLDGDLFGDERERYRWYEGIATAAQLQWIIIPWTAAIMVWPLGKPAVLPLSVVLTALVVSMAFATLYVRRRRVDPSVRSWRAKRLLLTVLSSAPLVVFVVGALYAYDPAGDAWRGAAVGGVLGSIASAIASTIESRRRRRREALAEDED